VSTIITIKSRGTTCTWLIGLRCSSALSRADLGRPGQHYASQRHVNCGKKTRRWSRRTGNQIVACKASIFFPGIACQPADSATAATHYQHISSLWPSSPPPPTNYLCPFMCGLLGFDDEISELLVTLISGKRAQQITHIYSHSMELNETKVRN
jgi:hypothetical protein